MSYESGVSSNPLRYQTIGAAMAAAADRHGDAPALIARAQGVRLGYRDLHAAARRLAAGFVALGLEPGERVGIWSPNRAEWVLTQMATAMAGLVLVTINPAYRLAELDYALNKVGCVALVTAPRFKTSDYVSLLHALAPEIARCAPGRLKAARVPALRHAILLEDHAPAGFWSFGEIEALGDEAARQALAVRALGLSPDDPINIQFTSGTTGFPKGATLTHHNILNNGYFVAARQGLGSGDRLCIPVPLYHCFGMVMGVLGCLTHGAAMVFPGEAFEPETVLKAIAAERCTALYGVPTMFIAMLEHPDFDRFDLSSLRTGVMAGAPCPEAVMRRVMAAMHMRDVTICYGMTETSPVSFQTLPGDPLDKRVTTVGRIHPFVEAKIVNGEGRVVPRGTAGELCTRGYSVMRGYWDDEARTREAIDAAGWMHTGDLAVMDADGYCAITGRVKDMIIRGGENIYPREIEEFLYRHPAIQDVQVFGVPDRKYGEAVCAWIKLKAGQTLDEADIKAFCKGQIAHFKVPHHVRFVDDYPMTVTGKVQKYLMREAMAAMLGEQGNGDNGMLKPGDRA
ncbi:MAG: AMP-binding protein [Alphaproteobacteria bacterium]|nr:MAG: AMP-binding protein [Alphaproteobacteria bacterium]